MTAVEPAGAMLDIAQEMVGRSSIAGDDAAASLVAQARLFLTSTGTSDAQRQLRAGLQGVVIGGLSAAVGLAPGHILSAVV